MRTKDVFETLGAVSSLDGYGGGLRHVSDLQDDVKSRGVSFTVLGPSRKRPGPAESGVGRPVPGGE
eukprot:11171304-Lingulodinium_polyedra.AAC.2